MRVAVRVVRAPLRAPFGAAWGSTEERELVLLALEDSRGLVGYGEAAPLEGYDGISVADVESALADCHSALIRSRGLDHAELLAECARRTVVPQALAAIDVALWDLAGQRADAPAWRLLGAGAPPTVEVNYTITAGDRAGAALEAAQARRAGFRCVKLKVGVGDDAGRVAAVRAAGGRALALRLDANGAWSPGEALANLRVLAPAGLELCEEPVSGGAAITELAASTPVPIAIDETAGEPGALDRRLCRAVCLKLGRCGGITGLLDAATRARRAGYEIYLASTLDGPIGIAAALHAAAVIAPDRPCGLATLPLFARRAMNFTLTEGTLAPPPGAGLGYGLPHWYR